MKRLALLLLLTCGFISSGHAGENEITARELAHHLGVSSWVAQLRREAPVMHFQVIHVQDGKPVKTLCQGREDFADRDDGRLALEVSGTFLASRITLQTVSGPWVKFEYAVPIKMETVVPLPRKLVEGDYLLGGELDQEKLRLEEKAPAIETIRNGLLLRVTYEQ